MGKKEVKRIKSALFKKSVRAQSSIEFLSTYSWALIVIIIALGAAVYFGIGGSQRGSIERCQFPPEIQCSRYSAGITDDGGFLRTNLVNLVTDRIEVSSWRLFTEEGQEIGCLIRPQNFSWDQTASVDIDFRGCDFASPGIVEGQTHAFRMEFSYYMEDSGPAYTKVMDGAVITSVESYSQIAGIVQCNDGIDNDGNGCADFTGGDTGCSIDTDTSESGGVCPGDTLNFTCGLSSSCSDTEIMGISDMMDGHAEQPGTGNFNSSVCCSSAVTTLDTSCGSAEAIAARLSGTEDAHVEIPYQANYATDICLSAGSGTAQCNSESGGISCGSGWECVAKLSSVTDGHVGSCQSTYPVSICCRVVST